MLAKDKNTRTLMSETKFYEGYSRWDEDKNRYETWEESVERVMNMHREFYADKMTDKLSNMIDKAEKAYKQKHILGAQRALQFGGEQLLKHHMKLYNCTSSYADRPEFFGEYFYILLCGAGVGFSVQKHHVAKLPDIAERKKQAKGYVVEDSIEGWANALSVLMSSYFKENSAFPEFEGRKVYFDLSNIRPKGAKISGGFKAPGPEGLRRALDKIEHLIQGLVLKGETRLRPIHIYDICMHTADAVLSGGVRRSATICLFSPDDEEMMNAKTDNWFIENPQRGRSNNSAVIVRDEISLDQFLGFMDAIKQFGEPGFYFVDDKDFTTNPCFSGNTLVAIANGDNKATIKELAEMDKPFPVYSAKINSKGKWKAEIKTAIAFKTGTRKTIKVTLNDGTSFRCTPEHKLAIPGGHYIQAKDSLNIELEGFFTHKEKNYRLINSFSNGYSKQHRLIWEYETDDIIPKGYAIDHIESGSTDHIENLQLLTVDEHNAKTSNERRGERNPVHRIKDMKKWKQNMSNKRFLESNGRFSGITNEELINNARLLKKNGMSITFENLKLLDSRSPLSFSKNRFDGNIQNLRDIIDNVKEYVEPKRAEKIENNDTPNSYSNPIVVSIEEGVEEDVYDLKVEDNSNFYILVDGDENYMNSKGILVHNCVEIGMYPQLDGKSGWQGCNLTEINGGACNSEEEFLEYCEAAAILGTLQAGYTDFKYLTDVSKKIYDREALLGVSITGWMNNPDVLLDEKVQRKGAKKVLAVNEKVAAMIGINPCARGTCVKPSGNASVLLETASGIHGEHSPFYLRNVQLNKESEVVQLILEKNPYMVEESVWSAGGTDFVVSFPVISPKDSFYKDELMGVGLLEKVKLVQQNWVEYGTRKEACADERIRHNVSNTVTVPDYAWDDVGKYLYENRKYFAGVSFLSDIGDKDFNQAPLTTVHTPKEIIAKYGQGALFASGLIVDTKRGFNDLWEACSVAVNHSDQNLGEDFDNRKDWIRRFVKFANNYFNGDLKQTEYCLKDVYLSHKWSKIQQNLVDIDFVEELTEKKFTDVDTLGAIACSGGSCEITF
jgi:hypothetical protein